MEQPGVDSRKKLNEILEAKKETTLKREFHSKVSIRFWEFH